uniref:Putative secreted protein n=1 Tax=Ixodes ricinus TaxID=34613 RepID=A0A6B0UCT4_IXORI
MASGSLQGPWHGVVWRWVQLALSQDAGQAVGQGACRGRRHLRGRHQFRQSQSLRHGRGHLVVILDHTHCGAAGRVGTSPVEGATTPASRLR